MLTFECPTMAFLFFLFPFLIYLMHFCSNMGGRVPYSFSVWGKANNYLRSSKRGRFLNLLSYIFFWLANTCIVIGLMGPAHTQQKVAYLDKGIDILFVLDESPSMGALDFGALSRFEHALGVLENFAHTATNDNLGLVTFASETVVTTPLTQDYNFFIRKLKDLYIMDLGDKTAIGNALALALLNMSYASSPTKIIVLITDGILNTGTQDISSLISVAQKMGVRIYTLGLGSKEKVNVHFTTREGKVYKGSVCESYDDKMLKKIAEQTGGQFFAASSSYLLSSAITKISSLETNEKRVRLDVSHTPLSSVFMLWTLILLLAYFFLRFYFLDSFL